MLVVIEGVDKSGKTTLVTALKDALPEVFNGKKVTFLRFPNRDGPIGSVIHNVLSGKIEMSAQTTQLLFAADRWHTLGVLTEGLANGGIVVCDRYIHSGIAYAGANGVDVTWCAGLNEGLPAPDLIIYLKLSEETRAIRGSSELEIYETTAIQRKVKDMYTSLIDHEIGFGQSAISVIDANDSKEIVVQHAIKSIVSAYTPDVPIRPFVGW